MSTPNIATAIVCDDVRTEKSGKHIIIGVYPGDILVPETPAHLAVMLWLQIDGIGQGDNSFEFRGSISGKDIVKGGFTVSTLSGGHRATVSLGQFLITVEEEGDLKFDVRFAEGGRWRNAISMPVRIRGSHPTA